MASVLPLLQTVADTLDGLGIATCVFDDADNTLLWNRSFLKFFPEQAAYIHADEPYAANLRRFYQVRLPPEELPAIDDYITRGIARHRAQQRSYSCTGACAYGCRRFPWQGWGASAFGVRTT